MNRLGFWVLFAVIMAWYVGSTGCLLEFLGCTPERTTRYGTEYPTVLD